MAKPATITVSNVSTSTRQKPVVSLDGKNYDCNELIAALQAARDMLPTDTFSRTVTSVATDDAAASTDANAAAGLKTP